MHHTGLGGDGNPVANLEMSGKAHLAPENDIIPQPCAACHPCLGDNQGVIPHTDVVPDLDEIIDLRAFADHCRPKGTAINRHVRANLDIIPDDDIADLRNFQVASRLKHITKAIRAEDHPRMDPHPVAQFRARIKDRVWKQAAILPHNTTGTDMVAPHQHGAGTNDRLLTNHTPGADVGGGIHPGGWGDHSRGVNSRCKDRLREKDGQDLGKRDARVGDLDDRFAGGREGAIHNNR